MLRENDGGSLMANECVVNCRLRQKCEGPESISKSLSVCAKKDHHRVK
jgi:hypothetical protein